MKVMVVDDELPIREWIRMMVQKVDDSLEVVACEASGEEAYQSFIKYQPELVISDIKMGNMDGIELLKKIKEILPNTYFVLLTSHNDFNYARDGIRYGANEYILKMEITVESIAKIVDNYTNTKEKTTHKKVKEYIEDVFQYVENSVFPQEVMGDIGKQYFVICVKNQLENVSNTFILSDKIKSIGEYYDREERQYFMLEGNDTFSLVSQYNEAFHVAKNFASVYDMKVGFSGACYEINAGIMKSRIGLVIGFYQDGAGVSTYVEENDASISMKLIELRQNCIRELYNDNLDHVIKILDEILKLAKDKKYGNIEELKNILLDIVHAYKLSLLSLGQTSEYQFVDFAKVQIAKGESFEEIYREIKIMFSRREDDVTVNSQYSIYTKKAIIFIKEHYKENISLIDIVEKLNINSEYFCRIFKKETGKTFLNYLTDYKINKAQELLIKSEYSIQEISDKLGYSSVAYFSRVFKNKTGENPYKYRSQ
ncbi:MAG: response regulator [Eubacteriales bacterium]